MHHGNRRTHRGASKMPCAAGMRIAVCDAAGRAIATTAIVADGNAALQFGGHAVKWRMRLLADKQEHTDTVMRRIADDGTITARCGYCHDNRVTTDRLGS